MDKKTLLSIVVTFLLTSVLGLIWANVAGVFERGQEALTEDQIKGVLTEVMVLDDGTTYGAAFSEARDERALMRQEIALTRQALEALSAE